MERIMFLFIIVLLIAGCASKHHESTPIIEESEQNKVAEDLEDKVIQRGFSLSPRSYENDDFIEFMERINSSFNILTWAGDWNSFEDLEKGSPAAITKLAETYNYTPVVLGQFFTQATGKLERPLNEENLKRYKTSALEFVKKYHPKYMILGIEVDVLYTKAPDKYDIFVNFYNELYDEIKKISPETLVSTTFELERVKGLKGGLFGGQNDPSKAEWFLIDQFKLDFVSFSTYPYLIYKNPDEMPDDYYTEIIKHIDIPIAFTEIGWYSDDTIPGWESNEEEQAAFVEKFFVLTKGLDIEFSVWSFMYDLEIEDPFKYTGLIDKSGHEKKGYKLWKLNEK